MNRETITTADGIPIDSNQNSLTAGVDGPILLQDFVLIDKIANFDRERIPERVVHAKGAGAHGYFEVDSADAKKYCKSKFLNEVGKKTPVFVRFSQVRGEKGSADTLRDPRGFAIKMYTEEGNFDCVANNTPVFFIRDPMKFPDFIHSQKKNPKNNLDDINAVWDFMSMHPESVHQFTILFSDRGTPASYRHMHGFGGHTFKLVNDEGKAFWCKWHFYSDAGIKNHSDEEAKRIAGEDSEFLTRDLFNHLDQGKEASWTCYWQIIPIDEGDKYKFNIFDITKVVSKKDYPLIKIGKLVLNKNPTNYFAEVEQAAFSPSHMVPGIEPSPDKMLQGRIFSYPDTHRHRLGPNYLQIPINRPFNTKVCNYYRDALMCVGDNGRDAVNYEPNSFGGPVADPTVSITPFTVSGTIGRTQVRLAKADDDFAQVRVLYNKVMTEQDRKNLISNIAGHMKDAKVEIQRKAVALFAKVDPDYGNRLSEALSLSCV